MSNQDKSRNKDTQRNRSQGDSEQHEIAQKLHNDVKDAEKQYSLKDVKDCIRSHKNNVEKAKEELLSGKYQPWTDVNKGKNNNKTYDNKPGKVMINFGTAPVQKEDVQPEINIQIDEEKPKNTRQQQQKKQTPKTEAKQNTKPENADDIFEDNIPMKTTASKKVNAEVKPQAAVPIQTATPMLVAQPQYAQAVAYQTQMPQCPQMISYYPPPQGTVYQMLDGTFAQIIYQPISNPQQHSQQIAQHKIQ